MNYLTCTLITGVGATALMDLWGLARKPILGMPVPQYAPVGRWIGHMWRGRFRHESIAAASPVSHESLIGWVAHYLIGIAFAGMLMGIWGQAWIQRPTLGPALIVGLGSVAAPFLVMQPALGAGIAASRTARPGAARVQSCITHTVFGIGLFAAGWLAHLLCR